MKIYLVATIKDIQSVTESKKVGNYGTAEINEIRTLGYFLTLEEAKYVIKNNVNDIHENYYKYAIIEEVSPGLYTSTESKTYWYMWTLRGYRRIKKPEQLKQLVSFTIG
jgi:phosphoribosylformylglycinamidine (FGAM) synthase PurS component